MSLALQGDRSGELIPFRMPRAQGSTEDAGAVEATAPALDGKPITEAEYQRSGVCRLAESAVSRLLAQWQIPESARQAGVELVNQALLVPMRDPAAVGRGLAVSTRAWWAWVRVTDFYEASKAADRLADKCQEIAVVRGRRSAISPVG